MFKARKITRDNFGVTPRNPRQLQGQQLQHHPGERRGPNSAASLLPSRVLLLTREPLVGGCSRNRQKEKMQGVWGGGLRLSPLLGETVSSLLGALIRQLQSGSEEQPPNPPQPPAETRGFKEADTTTGCRPQEAGESNRHTQTCPTCWRQGLTLVLTGIGLEEAQIN